MFFCAPLLAATAVTQAQAPTSFPALSPLFPRKLGGELGGAAKDPSFPAPFKGKALERFKHKHRISYKLSETRERRRKLCSLCHLRLCLSDFLSV